MHQKGKKGKTKNHAGKNNGPSRQRYWASGRLKERKIKALMLHSGMTRAEATQVWDARGRKK